MRRKGKLCEEKEGKNAPCPRVPEKDVDCARVKLGLHGKEMQA
jgi:hypothetical protein